MVGHDVDEILKPAFALRNNMMLASLALIAVDIILALLMSRSITTPITKLIKSTKIIGRGELTHRIDVRGKDEIGDLAQAFNDMTASLRQSLGETAHSQRMLLALSQAAQAVQRARTPDDVYRTVGDEVVRLGYHAVVFTLTADRQRLAIRHLTFESGLLRAAEKLAGVSAKDYRIPVERGGVYDQMVGERGAVFLPQILEPLAESLPKMARPLAGRILALLGLEQAIYAPLAFGGETQGILLVIGAGLNEADVPAVNVFANQTAIALENARAGEELRGHRDHLEELVEQRTTELKSINQELEVEIVERKRAEEGLRESGQWLSTMLRSIGDAVIATDAEGLVTLMNPVAEDLTGWDGADAVGQPLEDVLNIINEQTGERVESPVAKVLREGVVVGLANHTVLIARDGTRRPIADSGAPMRDEGGNIFGTVLVFRDITERRQVEEELAQRVQALERFNRLAVGRELRMVELKRQINALSEQLGKEAPYDLSILE